MRKVRNPRERIVQRSLCLKRRQDEFLDWAAENIPNFDWNKMVRDKLDEQIAQLNPEFLE